MRRASSTAFLLALAASLAGCWTDPCWSVACGERCTTCGAADDACMQGEQPHYCDAKGSCVVVLDPTVVQQPAWCAPGH